MEREEFLNLPGATVAEGVKACWWVWAIDGHQAERLGVEESIARLLDVLRASENLCADITICIRQKGPERSIWQMI